MRPMLLFEDTQAGVQPTGHGENPSETDQPPCVLEHEAEPVLCTVDGGRAAMRILLLPPSSLRPHVLTQLDL